VSRIYITHKGERLTLSNWARRINLPYDLVYKRYRNGYRGAALISTTDHRKRKNEKNRVAAKERRKEMGE